MSTATDPRTDIQWLAPSWTQVGDDPAIRMEPNGFLLNAKAREWVQDHTDGLSYILVGMSRDDRTLYISRVGGADIPRRVFVDRSVFKHWELEKQLRDKGYGIGSTLTFSETDDPDIIAATIMQRGV